MTLLIKTTRGYRRDYEHLRKCGYRMSRLDEAVRILSEEGRLPAEYYDHPLRGDLDGFRECHIAGDWILVYMISGDSLILTLSRTGRHEDIFRRWDPDISLRTPHSIRGSPVDLPVQRLQSPHPVLGGRMGVHQPRQDLLPVPSERVDDPQVGG